MKGSHSIHLSLYRRQQSLVAAALSPPSDAFRKYEARYRRAVSSFKTPVTASHIRSQLLRSDVIYFGDYHTLVYAQRSFLSWVSTALTVKRPVVLALEFVEGKHQSTLDAFLAGRVSERQFLRQIGHPYSGRFDIWPHFRPIFELARQHAIRVMAIDFRASGPDSLKKRDEFAAERIADCLSEHGKPRVMVLMGQYHVAPCHLPEEVSKRAPAHKPLVVYQNCEAIYWKLLKQRKIHQTEAVEIRDGELCLINASPVVCQQSFLDYLEAETHDSTLSPDVEQRTFEMAQHLARFFGVKWKAPSKTLRILTVEQLEAIPKLKQRGVFSTEEWRKLKHRIALGQSTYLADSKTIFLSANTLHHAAEQATHLVRHGCLGIRGPVTPLNGFYEECLQEALGFFGSKLINAHRRCTLLPEWVVRFSNEKGEPRNMAGYVLAHKAAEKDDNRDTLALLPSPRERLYHSVTQGLGYMLGEALYGAYEKGRVSQKQLRQLFVTDCPSPQDAYFEWVKRVKA